MKPVADRVEIIRDRTLTDWLISLLSTTWSGSRSAAPNLSCDPGDLGQSICPARVCLDATPHFGGGLTEYRDFRRVFSGTAAPNRVRVSKRNKRGNHAPDFTSDRGFRRRLSVRRLGGNHRLPGDTEREVEVPPTTSNASGDVLATLDTGSKKLNYTITYFGLSGPATAAHFHGPAAAGANAGVAVPIGSNPANPFTGSVDLTEAQMKDLKAGNGYANVRTEANKGGEIRGQLMRVK